ncbi:MAG: FAD-binding oxidoreductase, partial [Calditrichaeota bacterium]|nr:FAD-binding oxidoreductase [Calditrichota bacterium]
LVLLPKSVSEISKILSTCNQHSLKVIPSGGRTGLSGSATALNEEIVISMEKMNRIIEIDPIGSTITVEAGAILQDVQEATKAENLYFPLDFAAKGSCQIGGCLSTNAGGVKVLKYGMTRDIVMGIEVVLANGEILDLNKKLVKDNSGYKLEQLFIGAEGTLGIISKATFKCMPIPQNLNLLYLGVERFQNVSDIYSMVKKSGLDLTAFEFLTDIGVQSVLQAMPQTRQGLSEIYPFQVLIEVNEKNQETLEKLLEDLSGSGLIEDAAISHNSEMFRDLWTIREAVSDSLYLLGNVHANDVSIPVASLSAFLDDFEALMKTNYQAFTLGVFGHIGDGNLHIYIIDKNRGPREEFETSCHQLDKELFALVQLYDGSISAEHGIGLLKKDSLHFRRSTLEIELMRQIKSVFDPKGILNPGKIF